MVTCYSKKSFLSWLEKRDEQNHKIQGISTQDKSQSLLLSPEEESANSYQSAKLSVSNEPQNQVQGAFWIQTQWGFLHRPKAKADSDFLKIQKVNFLGLLLKMAWSL